MLALFEMEELRRRRFGELSTGNKQRMAVARGCGVAAHAALENRQNMAKTNPRRILCCLP